MVRPLETPEEFERAEEVQMSAWGMGPREATPKEVMIAINDNGGVVLGAFQGDRLIGFALTLLGYAGGRLYLYSHMTGVSKDAQSRGVGYLLKQAQREEAKKRGLDLLAWTFDPIISRNAHFNFSKLGVVARNYFPNYYGPMPDSINLGWETDRFLCEWFVDRAPGRSTKVGADLSVDLKDAHAAIRKGGVEPHARCVDWDVDLSARLVTVDIPSDVVTLKAADMEEGKRWRLGTREVFQRYFGAGYTAIRLLEDSGQYRYLLAREDLPENIFASSHTPTGRPRRTG